jgi:hypothetical protein
MLSGGTIVPVVDQAIQHAYADASLYAIAALSLYLIGTSYEPDGVNHSVDTDLVCEMPAVDVERCWSGDAHPPHEWHGPSFPIDPEAKIWNVVKFCPGRDYRK